MLPIESIFFPLKVVPMRIENNFKGHYIEKPLNLIQYVILLKSPNYDVVNIKWFTIIVYELRCSDLGVL